ncbi:MAG TPA: hypothetical protein VFF39_15785 [Verrucomicrobiae bacterium]|nr:hypothetical protein [Verrucomicrobiae bacterium]
MFSRALTKSFKTLLFSALLPCAVSAFAQTCASNRDAWDWTIPVSQTLYLNDGGVIPRAVNLPYYAFDGFATNLNTPSGPDVLPTNGWVLLFRSFGNSLCGTNMPYFILYNRYDGLLRVFFYNDLTTQTLSFGQVTLGESNTTDASLLNFDGGDLNHNLVTVDRIGPQQWSYADFSLTNYDPTPHTDATLNFDLNGITATSLTLTGGLTLDQVEQDAQMAGAYDRTKNSIGAFNSNFNSIASAAKTMNDQASHNKGTWWANAVTSLTHAGVFFAAEDLWGVAGFIHTFLGGGQTKAPPMHFQGQINATGTLQSTSEVYSFILRVPGQPHSNPNDLSLPLYDTKLGVFNAGVPDINRYEIIGDCGTDLLCIFNNPKHYQSSTPLTIQLNPNILTDATVTVSAAYTFFGSAPVTVAQTQATSSTISLDLSGMFNSDPSEVAVKLTICPNSAPVGQEPITVIKTYPVFVTDQGFE